MRSCRLRVAGVLVALCVQAAAVVPGAVAVPVISGVDAARCDRLSPAAGPVVAPPQATPALVAPVTAVWSYPPLLYFAGPAWNTGSTLAFQPPENYTGGFNLTGTSPALLEQYRLVRLEVRTVEQKSDFPLEIALVHRQVNAAQGVAARYAVVSVPLDGVAGSPAADVMAPASLGADLPWRRGRRDFLIGNGGSTSPTPFEPELFFANATFLHSWGPAGGVCGSGANFTRRFARRQAQPILPGEFVQWMSALRAGKSLPTQEAPPFAWMVQTCPKGATCPALTAAETSATLASATTQLDLAETALQVKKAAMDAAEVNLNKTGTANKVTLLHLAKVALDDLKEHFATVHGMRFTVKRLTEAMQELAKGWDAGAPAPTPATAANVALTEIVAASSTATSAARPGVPGEGCTTGCGERKRARSLREGQGQDLVLQ